MDYFTGKPVIDYATASATGMFDLRKQEWNGEILDYLGLKRAVGNVGRYESKVYNAEGDT